MALVALLVVIALIAGGMCFSLYLFSQNSAMTHRFERRMSATNEWSRLDNEHTIESPMYYGAMDTGYTSARYARGSLMVIALILLLSIMAIVSVLSGVLH